jgi:predicted transcriptional regulator
MNDSDPSTDTAPDLDFDVKPVGKGMRARVRVSAGGDVLLHDEVDLGKESKRSDFAARVAEVAGVPLEDVEAQLLRLADQREAPIDTSGEDVLEDDLAELTRRALEATDQDVRDEAERLLEDPELVARIGRDIETAGVAGEEELALTLYLIGTSRLLRRPLAGIVQGQTSSGKSYTIERVAGLFPPEAVVMATRMTPQALFHAKPASLSHRLVVAGERSRLENDDTAEATRALREMLSAGRLSKMMPMKVDGEIRTVVIEQEGPIAFLESTTAARIFEEDANRAILLSTDERRSQTTTILRRLALHASGKVKAEGERVADLHRTAQRLLERREILIPFAERLADLLEVFADKVECRRALPMLLSLIQASALLHQRQRQTDQEGRLIAEPADYAVAARLLSRPLGRSLGESLSDPARRFLDRLVQEVDDPIDPLPVPFTAKDVRRRMKTIGRSTVAGFLSDLEDKGFLDATEAGTGGRGRPPKAWRLTGRDGEEVDVLPPVEVMFPGGGGNKMDKLPPAKPK